MALTEQQLNPWRAIVSGGDYNLSSQDWEDLLTELDSLYTEAPIAQPASAPSEQKPEYTLEMGHAAERYFNSFGQDFNVRTPATFRYSELWDAMAGAAYTAPQPDYKAQRDALLDFANHLAESPKLIGTGWQEMAQMVVASVKGGE